MGAPQRCEAWSQSEGRCQVSPWNVEGGTNKGRDEFKKGVIGMIQRTELGLCKHTHIHMQQSNMNTHTHMHTSNITNTHIYTHADSCEVFALGFLATGGLEHTQSKTHYTKHGQ